MRVKIMPVNKTWTGNELAKFGWYLRTGLYGRPLG